MKHFYYRYHFVGVAGLWSHACFTLTSLLGSQGYTVLESGLILELPSAQLNTPDSTEPMTIELLIKEFSTPYKSSQLEDSDDTSDRLNINAIGFDDIDDVVLSGDSRDFDSRNHSFGKERLNKGLRNQHAESSNRCGIVETRLLQNLESILFEYVQRILRNKNAQHFNASKYDQIYRFSEYTDKLTSVSVIQGPIDNIDQRDDMTQIWLIPIYINNPKTVVGVLRVNIQVPSIINEYGTVHNPLDDNISTADVRFHSDLTYVLNFVLNFCELFSPLLVSAKLIEEYRLDMNSQNLLLNEVKKLCQDRKGNISLLQQSINVFSQCIEEISSVSSLNSVGSKSEMDFDTHEGLDSHLSSYLSMKLSSILKCEVRVDIDPTYFSRYSRLSNPLSEGKYNEEERESEELKNIHDLFWIKYPEQIER